MKMARCAKCQRRRPRKKLYLTSSGSGALYCWALDKCAYEWGENMNKINRFMDGMPEYGWGLGGRKPKYRPLWV